MSTPRMRRAGRRLGVPPRLRRKAGEVADGLRVPEQDQRGKDVQQEFEHDPVVPAQTPRRAQ
jgi:hypothetical protein